MSTVIAQRELRNNNAAIIDCDEPAVVAGLPEEVAVSTIASVAHSNGLDLYTRNAKDLADLEDLLVIRITASGTSAPLVSPMAVPDSVHRVARSATAAIGLRSVRQVNVGLVRPPVSWTLPTPRDTKPEFVVEHGGRPMAILPERPPEADVWAKSPTDAFGSRFSPSRCRRAQGTGPR